MKDRNYLPWEDGHYEKSGTYKKSNGDIIYCYTHYFSVKAEQIETKFPMDCGALNQELRDKFDSKTCKCKTNKNLKPCKNKNVTTREN